MKLYKFQTVNDNSIDALENLKLYFATSDKLNDPTESMFHLLDFNPEDIYSPDISNIPKIGILSMAVDDNSSIEESPFMWAHYGNELKGFCLVFNFNEFIRGIAQHVEKYGRVKYLRFPRLLSGDNLINETSGLENPPGCEYPNQNLKRIYDVCFFDKPYDFEKEQEFRFIAQQSGLKAYNPESLVKIIIGENMCDPDREKLLSVLSRLGIEHKVRIATVQRNSFKIHII